MGAGTYAAVDTVAGSDAASTAAASRECHVANNSLPAASAAFAKACASDRVAAGGFSIRVAQSFGNCPRYIQTRTPTAVPVATHPEPERLARLDAEALRLIAGADTFFIATAHPAAGHGAARDEGVDVSHRGGAPGFVLALGEKELAVPDFDGNRFFNTLGNLLLQPAAGLLFIDFERGDLLHVQVRGHIETGGAVMARMPPVERWLRFEVTGALRRPAAALGAGHALAVPALTLLLAFRAPTPECAR